MEPGGQKEDHGVPQKNQKSDLSSIHASNSKVGTFNKQGTTEATTTSKNFRMVEKDTSTPTGAPFLISTATDEQIEEAVSQGRRGYYTVEDYTAAVNVAALDVVTDMGQDGLVPLDDDLSMTDLGMDFNQKAPSESQVRHCPVPYESFISYSTNLFTDRMMAKIRRTVMKSLGTATMKTSPDLTTSR